MANDTERQRSIGRQRLARSIEHSYPRELSAFIDYIAKDSQFSRYNLQMRALEYARLHYNAAKKP